MSDRPSSREYRKNARIDMACPVYVHGILESGERVKAHSITDNVSEGGLFTQIPHNLKLGSVVFTMTQVLNGAKIAARGIVIRVSDAEEGLSGLAVCFNQPRLIPAI